MRVFQDIPMPAMSNHPESRRVDGHFQREARVDLRELTSLARWIATHWRGCGDLIVDRDGTKIVWMMPVSEADEAGSGYWNRVAQSFQNVTVFTVLRLGKAKYTLGRPPLPPKRQPDLLPRGDGRYAW